MNRFTFVFLSGGALLGLLFFCVPEIDVWVSGLFYTPAKEFLLDGDPTAKLLQPTLAWIIGSYVTVCIALLSINNLVCLHPLKTRIPFHVSDWSVLYLLLALALGPGLVVNGILKDHWGGRPREGVAFGGNKQFRCIYFFGFCSLSC